MPKPAGENPYAGRWIAKLRQQVVGQGGTPEQALHAARAARFKEKPEVSFVPPASALKFPSLFDEVVAAAPKRKGKVYLVGGAVRDALLGRPAHDLDFAVDGDALRLARKVANRAGGAYYRLDDERATGRVVLVQDNGERRILDFARLRGPDLETDLRGRDFTINAIAVDLAAPQELLDPLGGAPDLLAKNLRACAASAFEDDPVRILRAIRFAAGYSLKIENKTREQMKAAVGELGRISPERLRDELFNLFETKQPATSIRALSVLGVLPHTLPELLALKGVTQPPPHVSDVWEHTLHTLQHLETVLDTLSGDFRPDDKGGNLTIGLISGRLGRYRPQITTHLKQRLTPERELRPLLFLAALYHDIAKPHTRTEDEDGRVRFIGHETEGAKMAGERAAALRLSKAENDRLQDIIAHHLRPILLANEESAPSKRAIYRFFRDTGEAGVDICLLSLADVLAAHGPGIPQDVLTRQIDVVRALLEAYWESPEETIAPPDLVNGNDLIRGLKLKPGPQIGELLEAIREAQVEGEVSSKAEALKFARAWLKN
jgi:putative nucleotidyltransferase with HDIG domain